MKSIFICLVLFIVLNKADSQTSWMLIQANTLSPYAGASSLFLNGDWVMIATGDSAKVTVTTNGGIDFVTGYIDQFGGYENMVQIKPPGNSDNLTSLNAWVAGNTGKIYKTTNSSANWVLQPSGSTNNLQGLYFVNNQTGWCCGNSGTILKSTNGGANWSPQVSGTSTILNCIWFYNENTGWCTGSYAAGGAPVLKTTNGGANWVLVANGGTSISYYGMYFKDQNTGWICGNYLSFGLIMITTDGGSTWNEQTTPTGGVLRSIQFTGSDTGYCAGAQSLSGNTGRILKTINGGSGWVSQALPAGSKDLNDITFINSLSGFAVGNNGTILKTTTGGEPIGIHQISNEVPETYSISQNYPNPFNPSTKFRFNVPSAGVLKIVVLDISGKEIAVLANSNYAPGTYEADWDASKFASGVYFYRIQSVNFTETRKMILIK